MSDGIHWTLGTLIGFRHLPDQTRILNGLDEYSPDDADYNCNQLCKCHINLEVPCVIRIFEKYIRSGKNHQ